MKLGTKVFIKSLNKTGTVVECLEFPYGRVPLLWPFIRVNGGLTFGRRAEFFDPEDLEIIKD